MTIHWKAVEQHFTVEFVSQILEELSVLDLSIGGERVKVMSKIRNTITAVLDWQLPVESGIIS